MRGWTLGIRTIQRHSAPAVRRPLDVAPPPTPFPFSANSLCTSLHLFQQDAVRTCRHALGPACTFPKGSGRDFALSTSDRVLLSHHCALDLYDRGVSLSASLFFGSFVNCTPTDLHVTVNVELTRKRIGPLTTPKQEERRRLKQGIATVDLPDDSATPEPTLRAFILLQQQA